jgi:hypothetical protein
MFTIDASRMTTKSAIASNTNAHQRRSARPDCGGMVALIGILRPLFETALSGGGFVALLAQRLAVDYYDVAVRQGTAECTANRRDPGRN